MTVRKVPLLALILGLYAPTVLGQRTYKVERDAYKVDLSKETMILPPNRDFYVETVVDLRTDTNLIGSGTIVKGGMAQSLPILFPESTPAYLERWFAATMPGGPGMQPLMIQILQLHCREFNTRAACWLKVRVLSRDAKGLRDHGKYKAFFESKGLNATKKHKENIAKCFASVLRYYRAANDTGRPLASDDPGQDCRGKYDWPVYRFSHPDSLPDGLYRDVVAFRKATPDPAIVYKAEEYKVASDHYLIITHGNNMIAGQPVTGYSFAVFKGNIYAMIKGKLLPAKRDLNGLIVPYVRYEDPTFDNQNALGQLVWGQAEDGSISGATVGVRIETQYIVDLRQGNILQEDNWDSYNSRLTSGKPITLHITSEERDGNPIRIYFASDGDTSSVQIEAGATVTHTLNKVFSTYRVSGPEMEPESIIARPGILYMTVRRKDDEVQMRYEKIEKE